MAIPSWLPDWEHPSQYPEIKQGVTQLSQLSGQELAFWAWQFLRRNPDYQHYYQQNSGVLDSYQPRAPADKLCVEPAEFHIYMHHAIKPPFPAPEEFSPPTLNFYNPKAVDCLVLEPNVISGSVELREKPASMQIISHAQALVRFNLNGPIGPQIKVIQKKLTERVDYIKKQYHIEVSKTAFTVELFPAFLRILDAGSIGIGDKEAAAVIYPGEENTYEEDYVISKRISDQRKRASEIMRGSYRHFFTPDVTCADHF